MEPRGPGVSENPTERAAEGVRAERAWRAQEEGGDTRAKGGMFKETLRSKDARARVTKPGIKFTPLT